jgi:hypothetical protein
MTKMLSYSKSELHAMSKNDVIKHVLSLQREKEVFEKLFPSILTAMTHKDLVDHTIVLQDEIEWRKLQHMTGGGVG